MDKEFKDLNVAELREVANNFAVDLDGVTKKADIIAELEENGVTFSMYRALVSDEEAVELSQVDDSPLDETGTEPSAPVEEQVFLIKMTRPNHSYEIRGYRFTRDNPYALVSEEDADYLIEHGGGFQLSSPKELKEYYGRS